MLQLLQQTVKIEREMTVEQFSDKLLEALKTSKIVHTTGCDPKGNFHEFWDEVTNRIGDCIPMSESLVTGEKTGNKWIEIRYDASISNAYRHSKKAQPLHTDGSYESNAPEIVFFYCINQASKGGETVFFDSYELIGMLKNEDKSLFDDLCNTPICFSKANDHKIKQIISFDEQGRSVLTWNYYCVDPSETEFAKNLAERFHAFLQSKVMAASKTHPVRLLPGDAVFFHDERLLHGRNAFDANENNERFLLKAGFNLNKEDKTR